MGGIAIILSQDTRKFRESEDRVGTCRKCGARLMLLQDDRRQGFCFDCYDVLELKSGAAW